MYLCSHTYLYTYVRDDDEEDKEDKKDKEDDEEEGDTPDVGFAFDPNGEKCLVRGFRFIYT
jgi:hypothetical protein